MVAIAGKIQLWNSALSRIGESKFIQSLTETNSPAVEICDLHYDRIVQEMLEANEWPFAMRQVSLSSRSTQVTTTVGDPSTLDYTIPYQYLSSSQLSVRFQDSTSTYFDLTISTHYAVAERASGEKFLTLNSTFTDLYGTPQTDESIEITVAFTLVGWDYVYALPSDLIKPTAFLHNELRNSLTGPQSRLEYAVGIADDGETRVLGTNASSSDFDALEYTANIDNVGVWSSHFQNAIIWALAAELADGLRKEPKLAERCIARAERALSAAIAFERNYESQRAEPTTESLLARNA